MKGFRMFEKAVAYAKKRNEQVASDLIIENQLYISNPLNFKPMST